MLKRPVAFLAVAVSMALLSPAFAAVWDEPWHREVVSRAHTLGLYDVVTASPTTGWCQHWRGRRGRRPLCDDPTGDVQQGWRKA